MSDLGFTTALSPPSCLLYNHDTTVTQMGQTKSLLFFWGSEEEKWADWSSFNVTT